MEQTIYIKLNKSACVDGTDVFISDIAGVYCEYSKQSEGYKDIEAAGR